MDLIEGCVINCKPDHVLYWRYELSSPEMELELLSISWLVDDANNNFDLWGKKYKNLFFFWKTHFTILYNGASPLWNQKFPHTSVPKTWHTSKFDTNLTTLPLDWTLVKIVTVKFCGPKVKCFNMVWLGCDIWVNHDPHTTPFHLSPNPCDCHASS